MRVLCLIDSIVNPGDHWLWDYLPPNDDRVDFLYVVAKDRFAKWGKLLTYYPLYVGLGLRATIRALFRPYDVIVAWEGKSGFPLAVMRSILRLRSPRMVILAYNQRGIVAHLPFLQRFALQSVDRVVVLSRWEKENLARSLGLPPEKVVFCALGWYDVGEASGLKRDGDAEGNGFIFASGRSYRDYGTFIRALEGVPCRAVINARRFNLAGLELPQNVTVNDLLPMQEFWQLLRDCRFFVVPLQKIPHSGGDTVILQAMAAGRAVIATRSPSSETYVEEGVTGIIVPPGDAVALRRAMNYLIDRPDEAERMGKNARKKYEECYTFADLAERVHQILENVVHEN